MTFMDFLKYTSLFCSTSYYVLKYKCGFMTFNNAVMTICNSLLPKNYIFTKIVQWGVQEINDSLHVKNNEELVKYFSTFNNSVPYNSDELQYSLHRLQDLVAYAKAQNNELIIENSVPINSGSVALVFKAQLNGDSVIIKVLRCNMKNRIENDIHNLMCFFDNILIKKITEYYTALNFSSFIESIKESLLTQCDFNNEINNSLLFKNNLKNNKNIIIPHMYKYFTETFNDVIVMEYINGPIAKNVSLDKLQPHLEHLQLFFFESMYRYNILHADFHLGNIIIVDDNTVGIIDFGIVYELTNEISDTLFDFMFMLASLDPTKKSFHKTSCKIVKKCIQLCCRDEHVYDLVYTKIINDLQFMEMFKEGFSVNRLAIVIKKLISMQDNTVVLKSNICQLFLSTLSGIQTIEFVNDGSTLHSLVRSFINRSVDI